MVELSVIPIHTEEDRAMGILKFEVTFGEKKCLISVLRKFQPKNRKEYHAITVKVDGETVWSSLFDITKHPPTRKGLVDFLSTLTTLDFGKYVLQRITNCISDAIVVKQASKDENCSHFSVDSVDKFNHMECVEKIDISRERDISIYCNGCLYHVLPTLTTLNSNPTSNSSNTNSSNIMVISSDGKIYNPNEPIIIDGETYTVKNRKPPLEPRYDIPFIIKYLNRTSPEIWTPASLFDRLQVQYNYYIDFPHESWYYVFPLWVMGTYIFPIFNAYPYIELYGGANTGKTKTMELSAILSFNGRMSVGISPSALFRGTEIYNWSLFIDEANLFNPKQQGSERKEDILSFLKCGYKKGTPVIKSEKSGEYGTFNIVTFDTYCPKMFATNYETEEILATRQIRIVMRPASFKIGRGERQPKFEHPFWTEFRTQLMLFALKNATEIKKAYDSLENEFELPNRDFELWKPIISIAKFLDEGDFAPDYYRQRALKEIIIETIKAKQAEIIEGVEYQILKALLEVNIWNDYTPLKTIIEKIQGYHEKDQEWLTPRFIGRIINKMNLQNQKRRIGRGMEFLFKKEDVEEMFDRYGFTITEDKIISRSKIFTFEDKFTPEIKVAEKPEYEEDIKLRNFMKDVEKAKMED